MPGTQRIQSRTRKRKAVLEISCLELYQKQTKANGATLCCTADGSMQDETFHRANSPGKTAFSLVTGKALCIVNAGSATVFWLVPSPYESSSPGLQTFPNAEKRCNRQISVWWSMRRCAVNLPDGRPYRPPGVGASYFSAKCNPLSLAASRFVDRAGKTAQALSRAIDRVSVFPAGSEAELRPGSQRAHLAL